MPSWRRRRLGIALMLGVFIGLLGAIQTFAYFRLAEFAAPVPPWFLLVMTGLTGVSVRPLTGSAWAATWTAIVSAVLSLVVYALLWMYPFIAEGYSLNLLLIYFAHVAGADALMSWLFYYPLVFTAGFMISLPLADYYRL